MDRRRRAALAESPSCIRLGGLRARRSPRTVSERDDGIRRDAARLASGLGQRARRSLLAQATVCPKTALSAPPWASDTLVYRRFMLQPRVWRYMRIMPGSSQQARLAPLVLANDGLAGVPSCSLSDDRRNRQRPRDIGGGRSVKPPPQSPPAWRSLFSVVITSANRCQMGAHGYPGSGGVFARRCIGAGLIAFGAWTGLLAGAAAARGEARVAVRPDRRLRRRHGAGQGHPALGRADR